jgi:hypothetical protein
MKHYLDELRTFEDYHNHKIDPIMIKFAEVYCDKKILK